MTPSLVGSTGTLTRKLWGPFSLHSRDRWTKKNPGFNLQTWLQTFYGRPIESVLVQDKKGRSLHLLEHLSNVASLSGIVCMSDEISDRLEVLAIEVLVWRSRNLDLGAINFYLSLCSLDKSHSATPKHTESPRQDAGKESLYHDMMVF